MERVNHPDYRYGRFTVMKTRTYRCARTAGTEANNRLIKDATGIAFGFRNLNNQRRRVRLRCKRTMIS